MQRRVIKSRISKKKYSKFPFERVVKENLEIVGTRVFKAKTEKIITEKPQGEIQSGTVGYCSIKNFKNIISNMADSREEFTSCLNQFMEEISDIVYGDGGKIDKFSQDGVLFYFPIDKNTSDSPTRATSASLKMRYRVNKLNRKWNFNFNKAWFVSIGINSGSVQIESIENGDSMFTSIKGEIAEIARAIGRTAATGKVLVTDETYNSKGFKRGFFHIEEPYHLQPRGIDAMTKVYEITGMVRE